MKSATSGQPPDIRLRAFLFLAGVTVLVAVYIFQRINFAAFVREFPDNTIFVINRTTRLILNDLACFLIIFALFREKKYLRVACWVFLVEILLILPVYLVVKLSLEGDSEISSPLLSQIHRLIVNPMLMLLLIVGFLYQRQVKGRI